MSGSHPLEDVPSSLQSDLEDAWERFSPLSLFEIRALQQAYWSGLALADHEQYIRCRLAVLETLEMWKHQKQKEIPPWEGSTTEHVEVVCERLEELLLEEEGTEGSESPAPHPYFLGGEPTP